MRNKIIFFFLLFFLNFTGFTKENTLTDREKEFLVNLSRQTLYWYLKYGEIPSVDKEILTDNIKSKKACFVTLYKKGVGLRGCMGLFFPKEPLYKNVIDRTIAAATKDPRFKPVKYGELKDIKLEISVLTDPVTLKFNSPQELLDKLQPLRDGVIIITKYGSSTYLPQVWKQLPNKRDFLSNLCVKQGAPYDYWETNFGDITVQTYQAIVFGEEIYGRIVVGKKGAIVGEKGAFLIGTVKPLKEDFYYGGYKINKGVKLMPGTILTPDSDIVEE
jgi:AmmeMemoRadiSam system protein A